MRKNLLLKYKLDGPIEDWSLVNLNAVVKKGLFVN